MDGFQWQDAGNRDPATGKMLLVGSNGPVLVLDFYNYTQRVNSQTLLIWSQPRCEAGPTAPIHFTALSPKDLKPLEGDLNRIFSSMKSSHQRLAFNGEALAEFELETTEVEVNIQAEFPPLLIGWHELLLFCSSSGIGGADEWSSANLALLIADLKASTYRLYPQDWFNHGAFDYGYQWATRVVRDPMTEWVHGEGIRIGSFILDDSLRQLRQR